MFNKKAFSMIELMVGVCIFALAILPIVWLGSRQTSNAFSAGKHMMAGQLASSYMDDIIRRPYKDIEALSLPISGNVLDSPKHNLKNPFDILTLRDSLADNTSEDGIHSPKENMDASFRRFRYEINKFTENKDKKIIGIEVTVYYRVKENDENTEQSVKLYALKHGERTK